MKKNDLNVDYIQKQSYFLLKLKVFSYSDFAISHFMYTPQQISSETFSAILSDNKCKFVSSTGESQLKPILPSLIRAAFCPSTLTNTHSSQNRNELKQILLNINYANTLMAYLSCDFVTLVSDLKKDAKIRRKSLIASGCQDTRDNIGI